MDDFTREYLKRKEENKGVKPQLIPSTSQTFQQVNQASQKQAQTIKQESAKQKASYNTLKQTSGADEARKEYERRISRLQQQKTELTAGLDLDGAARVQDQIDSMRREMNGVSRFESAVTGAIGTYLGILMASTRSARIFSAKFIPFSPPGYCGQGGPAFPAGFFRTAL